jgi:phosphoribosylformimino-5-aminoimidazole carboxamide ribotide isomerase
MLVIPAIDIRNGNSVRLKQGKIEGETIHSNNPVQVAKLWKASGAKRIHIVDLDAAINGISQNLEIIKQICLINDIDTELGGGIRNEQKLDEVFNMGAKLAVLGTAAVLNPDFVDFAVKKYGAEKIIIAIDASKGMVAIKGWKELSQLRIDILIDRLKQSGIKQILYTDISRDGMLTGPDFEGLSKLVKSGLEVIASGGIKAIDDLLELKKLEKEGLIGAIVGAALYTKDFNLKRAIEIAK